MLLARQANSRVHHQRMMPARYDDHRYQPTVVYVDEYGRPIYEDRYDIPYADARANDADYYHVDQYRNNMAPSQNLADHYAAENMVQPPAPNPHPFQVSAAPRANQRRVHIYDAPHVNNHAMQEQAMHYVPNPGEISQQWATAGHQNLLPFEQHLAPAPQELLQMQAPMAPIPEQEATYALDPMLAANPMEAQAETTYGQLALDGSNFPATEDYRNVSMPSDIIAGRWARDQNGTDEDEQPQENVGVHVQQEPMENMDNLLPLMEGGDHLPSQHIDFGDKGELFGGDLNHVLPIDPDIEDYNAALNQQQDMEALLAQL